MKQNDGLATLDFIEGLVSHPFGITFQLRECLHHVKPDTTGYQVNRSTIVASRVASPHSRKAGGEAQNGSENGDWLREGSYTPVGLCCHAHRSNKLKYTNEG